jgi:hypothetical protein
MNRKIFWIGKSYGIIKSQYGLYGIQRIYNHTWMFQFFTSESNNCSLLRPKFYETSSWTSRSNGL